jgi:hypothetical protein
MAGLLKNAKELYFHYQSYSFDVEKRSELFDIFKDIFQEIILSLNTLKANDMIRYINFEILRNNDDLFEYLKKRVVVHELKAKKVTSANVDEVVSTAITLIQSDKSINYNVLVIEQLKQFYNLQANQVSVWSEEGGEQIFRNDSQKFNELDDEFHMYSELLDIEDRFKDIDSNNQSEHEEGPFYDSGDNEIVPHYSYGSKFHNSRNRLKLDIMDLEGDDTSDDEDERTKHNNQLKKQAGNSYN